MTIPPAALCVVDRHGGFTAITRTKVSVKIVLDPIAGERVARSEDYTPTLNKPFVRWEKRMVEAGTLWRPADVLKGNTVGALEEYDEQSFFQLNNNVTKAVYKVHGYQYRVAVWFDNVTKERIA